MSHHEKTDKQVVYGQLLCLFLATSLGLSSDLFSSVAQQIIYKFVDAIFITGTILIAMKMAREGWDLPAAGFTIMSIAWGVFFLAKDFQEQSVGNDIISSSFYFILPSMILISFYTPFPLLIKLVTLLTIIPSLVGLIEVKTGSNIGNFLIWRKINYQAIHIVSLTWAIFLFWQYRMHIKVAKPD